MGLVMAHGGGVIFVGTLASVVLHTRAFHEGVLVHRAHAGHFLGLLLICTPAFGADSTPRLAEWVGAGVRPFGMSSPHGLAPFRFGDTVQILKIRGFLIFALGVLN